MNIRGEVANLMARHWLGRSERLRKKLERLKMKIKRGGGGGLNGPSSHIGRDSAVILLLEQSPVRYLHIHLEKLCYQSLLEANIEVQTSL